MDLQDREHTGIKVRKGTVTPKPVPKTKDTMYKEE